MDRLYPSSGRYHALLEKVIGPQDVAADGIFMGDDTAPGENIDEPIFIIEGVIFIVAKLIGNMPGKGENSYNRTQT